LLAIILDRALAGSCSGSLVDAFQVPKFILPSPLAPGDADSREIFPGLRLIGQPRKSLAASGTLAPSSASAGGELFTLSPLSGLLLLPLFVTLKHTRKWRWSRCSSSGSAYGLSNILIAFSICFLPIR